MASIDFPSLSNPKSAELDRNGHAGLRTSAYFLGNAGLNLIDITVQPAIFMSLYYTLTLPEIDFLRYYTGKTLFRVMALNKYMTSNLSYHIGWICQLHFFCCILFRGLCIASSIDAHASSNLSDVILFSTFTALRGASISFIPQSDHSIFKPNPGNLRFLALQWHG